MYSFFFQVNQDGLRSFLSIAEDLRVRGLTQNDHANSRKTEEAGMLQDVDSRPYNGNGNVPRNRKRMRSNSVEQEETEIRSPNNHLSHHQINNGHISDEPSSPRKSVHSAHTSPFRQGTSLILNILLTARCLFSSSRIRKFVWKYLTFVSNMCLNDEQFQNQPPFLQLTIRKKMVSGMAEPGTVIPMVQQSPTNQIYQLLIF